MTGFGIFQFISVDLISQFLRAIIYSCSQGVTQRELQIFQREAMAMGHVGQGTLLSLEDVRRNMVERTSLETWYPDVTSRCM